MRRPYQRQAVLRPTPEALTLVRTQLANGQQRFASEISKATAVACLDQHDVLAAAIELGVRVIGKGGARVWSLPEVKT